jgi:CubicO group peptidase (beta-lactamase class C family)
VSDVADDLDSLALATSFAGVVRLDEGDSVLFERAYGLASRSSNVPNTLETRFATASGTKGLTALTIASLVEDGSLTLAMRARTMLGADLPLISDEVTVEHLLAHRSGIGDYLDEDQNLDFREYLMPVPVHELATTERYLPALDGLPAKFPPGERFSYCNSGYVVLALIAERVAGVPFHELVVQRVCDPAGLGDTAFFRSDELPERAATGYLDVSGCRTNVFHLPVRGSGDGGIYTTVGDVARFWRALFSGKIVPVARIADLIQPRSSTQSSLPAYGLGFWLDPDAGVVALVGSDAGVSFATQHAPGRVLTATVISNTTDGAWPLMRLLRDRL